MEKSPPALAVIHVLSYQGERMFGDKWAAFINTFRNRLKQYGIEEKDSSANLLQFSYNHPHAALASVFESLEETKKEYGWKKSTGIVPIQIIFHIDKPGDPPPPIRDISADLWDLLHQETPYVTRQLKQQWNNLMSGKKLPDLSFEQEGQELCQLVFKKESLIRSEKLFPNRELPVLGSQPECFYCGMTNHKAAACPAKFLTMETQGLPYVGFIPIDRINDLYQTIFSNFNKYTELITAGIPPAKIRKEEDLQVLVAYFDQFIIFQPRFLWNTAFSINYDWDNIYRSDKINIDNQPLYLGFDCLRAGNYSQAEELFEAELKDPGEKKIFAAIGLAFMYLEKGQPKYMSHYLQKAVELASQEKERIYTALLLARFYDLQGNLWKADNTLNQALTINRNCVEAKYSKVQMATKSGFGEKVVTDLRPIVEGQQEFFMIALLDPILLPVQGLVNEMLSAIIHDHAQSALGKLNKAQEECDELTSWFDKDDRLVGINLKTLANLKNLLEEKSYYGIQEAAERALGLVYSSQRIQENKIDALREQLNEITAQWTNYKKIWDLFNYKPLFESFNKTIISAKQKIITIRAISEKMNGNNYRKSIAIKDEIINELITLKHLITRMNLVKSILDATRLFGKYLLLSEIILLSLTIALFTLLANILEGSGTEGILRLVNDPWFKKQSISITTLLIAPMTALIMTSVKSFKK
ncbi:MAG: hypothetical protein KKB30_04165 [Proteobacteria bacterium]|nr:hypothetical protein [Pseudomonadota bacterium]MBU1714929.1 hypothetical protein [Pseudomonadota bacterium]